MINETKYNSMMNSYDNYENNTEGFIHDDSSDYDSANEALSVSLYNELSSTIYNCLDNSLVRNSIKKNNDILKHLELQIANLFYLESELKNELNNEKNSATFLQIIANIAGSELVINKSNKKNRIRILEERNSLIVTIVNTYKNINREDLEKYQLINENMINQLENKIISINNFNQEEVINNNSPSSIDSNNNQNNDNREKEFRANSNINPSLNNLNNSINFLAQQGKLPSHPATNAKFYPYINKPLIIPKIKKALASFLVITALLLIAINVLSFFVGGNIQVSQKGTQVFVKIHTISDLLPMFLVVFLTLSIAYLFLRPKANIRDVYHTPLSLLIILLLLFISLISYYTLQLTDNGIKQMILAKYLKNGEDFRPEAISDFRKSNNFHLYSIFVICIVALVVFPLVLTIILLLFNPKLDREKINRANIEYQNAISAALQGQNYVIDPGLFDELPKKKHKKSIFDHMKR